MLNSQITKKEAMAIVGHYRGFDVGSTGPGKLRATPSGLLNRSELQKCGRTSSPSMGRRLPINQKLIHYLNFPYGSRLKAS